MDWKDLGKQLAALGLPLLGAALPVPGGAALGTALAAMLGVSKPEEVAAAVQNNAEALSKAQEFEAGHRERILTLLIDAEKAERQSDSADISTVNETIREELRNSANEAWYQKAWRPANGFCVALGSFVAVIFTCYLLYLAIVMKDVAALNAVPALATSIGLILAVPGAAVGIASWHRGQKQRTLADYVGKTK